MKMRKQRTEVKGLLRKQVSPLFIEMGKIVNIDFREGECKVREDERDREKGLVCSGLWDNGRESISQTLPCSARRGRHTFPESHTYIQSNPTNCSSKSKPTFDRPHSITLAGVSEYRYNSRVTAFSTYNSRLESFNILVKAKNFLVFQGDVEAVASQNSKDLSKLIDQISGSLELKEAYDKAKEKQDKATEESNFNYQKRRGINAELKGFKEMKSEAERWEKLLEQKVSI